MDDFRRKWTLKSVTSKRLFIEALDGCPPNVIRRVIRRAERHASIYRQGATGPVAEYAAKKYRSHRAVTQQDLALAAEEKAQKDAELLKTSLKPVVGGHKLVETWRPPPYLPVIDSCYTIADRIVGGVYIPPLLAEASMLVLQIVDHVRRRKRTTLLKTPLLSTLFRDGYIYF
ncbi:7437_t:CDS:2, partial [Acaulospora colombiana]